MPQILSVITKSEQETQKFASLLAQEILKSKSKKSFTLGLSGELGAGKTSFAKGFAKGLGIKEEMKSPTFILMRAFRVPLTQKHFLHFDAYRITNAKEFLSLGFRDMLSNNRNILLVEWADKIKKIMPKNALKLSFKTLSKNSREITLSF